MKTRARYPRRHKGLIKLLLLVILLGTFCAVGYGAARLWNHWTETESAAAPVPVAPVPVAPVPVAPVPAAPATPAARKPDNAASAAPAARSAVALPVVPLSPAAPPAPVAPPVPALPPGSIDAGQAAPAASPELIPEVALPASVAPPPVSPRFLETPVAAIPQVWRDMHPQLTPTKWGEHLPGILSRLSSEKSGAAGTGTAGTSAAGTGTAGTSAAGTGTAGTSAAGTGASENSAALTGPASAPRPGGTVVLTLDACGGKAGRSYDAGIIVFLRENRIPATIFVTSLWMKANPEILKELAGDPLFELAAHGARHRPCSVNGRAAYGIKGTASLDELAAEVEGNARALAGATGTRPRWFRAGTAFYDDVAVDLIRLLGLGVAGYSVTGDQGATLPAAKVAARVGAARDGDILLLHLNHPKSGTREGLKDGLTRLRERGFRIVRLP